MIQVSNEFKKAIKEQERRIKGYVEVLYDLPSVTVTPSVNITSTYTPTSEISNGVRVENLYGSVDYLPLDGSYITMGDTNTNIGYISDELFENLTNPTITLSFSSTTINGITMYFRENSPTNMTLNYSDGTSQTITNEENTVQVIFNSPKTLTSVSITINDMMYQDRKIYCMEIDLGVTEVYKDQDLIEFTIDEEVNKLVEEVPINETNIVLNNMTDLFNPLNPKGIVPYLREDTLIKPYIGVLTESLGVEYVKMGEFYFDSYTNNSDATTTLVGKNIIKQIETEKIKFNRNSAFFQTGMNQQEAETFLVNYDYNIQINDWARNSSTIYWKNNSFAEFLRSTAFYEDDLIYVDRNNTIYLKRTNNLLVDNLTKTELINDVIYYNIDKINTIYLIGEHMGSNASGSSRTILNETITLKNTEEIYAFSSSNPDFYSATLNVSGGTATVVGDGFYLTFIKIQGAIGSQVTITLTTTQNYAGYQKTSVLTNKGSKKEVAIEFNSPVNMYADSSSGFVRNSDILSRTPSYKMSFDYNGDPSLEAGDYINVETPYGYKPLFIQKNRFKFDGGLSGSIEGVE